MSASSNRRRIELNQPIMTADAITRRRFLAGTGAILTGPAFLTRANQAWAAADRAQPARTTRVRFRMIDAQSGETTPAMACIVNCDSQEVHLPPDGAVSTEPSNLGAFIRGVEYSPDPNWIGPVRKMQGLGDNSDRSYVYENRPSLPYWPDPVVYQTPGTFAIDLPAGRWRIRAGHGMEYIPAENEFEVSGSGELETTLRLERWIDLPAAGWWSGDVHVHHPTRNAAQREFLMQYALAEDVHVVNLLEMGHHLGTDFPQAGFGPEFRVQQGDFVLVAGQEDPRSTFGHIIGLNLQAMVRDLATYDHYDVTFRGIQAQPGALVGFAHFAWNGCDLPRGFPWLVTTEALDFVELLQFGMLNGADYADYLNLGFRLTAAAGSDIPWGSTLGEVRTFVHLGPEFDVDAWFRNFKAGHTFVSNGPAIDFTVDGALPGTELTPAAGSRVKVHARALGHPKIGLPTVLQVIGTEGLVQEVRSERGERELTIDLERRVAASEWLMVSVTCDNGALAHSTPIYLVVDGQPTWNRHTGPAIIDRQLRSIAEIESEFATGDDDRTVGIRVRLEQARAFYDTLRQKMSA